jgi:hypothetical protein
MKVERENVEATIVTFFTNIVPSQLISILVLQPQCMGTSKTSLEAYQIRYALVALTLNHPVAARRRSGRAMQVYGPGGASEWCLTRQDV